MNYILKIYRKKKTIVVLVIALLLMVVCFMFFRELGTTKEIPKKATYVFNNIIE
jgi:hypothetical protein